MRVNASEAACLIGVSEKTLRAWCASGKLPAAKVSRLGQPDSWEIELEDLRALPLDRDRLRLQEAWLDLHRAALNPRETTALPEPTGTSKVSSMQVPGMFGTRTAAARWLARHGVAADTARRWPGWEELPRLDPDDVLRLALRVYDPANARYTWKLHRCDDAGCVCHELL